MDNGDMNKEDPLSHEILRIPEEERPKRKLRGPDGKIIEVFIRKTFSGMNEFCVPITEDGIVKKFWYREDALPEGFTVLKDE